MGLLHFGHEFAVSAIPSLPHVLVQALHVDRDLPWRTLFDPQALYLSNHMRW